MTFLPSRIVANLEKGRRYSVKGSINGEKVRFDVVDADTSASATLDMMRLGGQGQDVISQYIKYVLNPTMDEIGNTVLLENEQTKITFSPDLMFTKTDLRSGSTTAGRAGFEMDFAMNTGKEYLLLTDVIYSTVDEFLNKSNYKELAQIVLVPIACNAASVTYRYERPEEQKGQEVTFRITELKK